MGKPEHRFCVAPMLDWTDRHCRFFLRLISRHAWLYTEMVTSAALLHVDNPGRFLDFDPSEHPLALQLGGSDPAELASCARMVADWGYDEVNLNVGCPSDRVQSGRFGACLMAEPSLVAECVAAMAEGALPVTVKTRVGIDDRDSYPQLAAFIETVAAAGCGTFIVHARKAWLQGLSPKQNREIPPLNYDRVYRLKQDFPGLTLVLNGGLTDLAAATGHLQHLDGVMVGREVYHNPYNSLVDVDRLYYGDQHPLPSRHQVMQAFAAYADGQLRQGVSLQAMTRHILGLFHGQPGARRWRRQLSEQAHRSGAGLEVLTAAALPPAVDGGGTARG